jgi:hypothetical protein
LSGLPFVWNGFTFNAASPLTYTYHTTNSQGCDSSATLNLTILSTTSTSKDTSVCLSGLPFTWNGLSFAAAGSQTYHTTNSVGCDSSATLNLTILSATSSSKDTSVCLSGLPFSWNGLSFAAAGSQTYHTTNSVGCDSSATLNLTILSATSSSKDTAVCLSGLPFVWNGLSFAAAGSQTYHTTNSVGCDSSATLNVTVLNATSSSKDTSVCLSGLPFTWNGHSFNAASPLTFTYHTTNSQGCDSSATLIVTILSATASSKDTAVCLSGLPFVWNGFTFNAASPLTYTYHTTNSQGCDSSATLNLTILSATSSSKDTAVCLSGLPFVWNGLTFAAAGSQTYHTTNSVGCDSSATLNLTILNATSSSKDTSVCASGLPFSWNGLSFAAAGSQT